MSCLALCYDCDNTECDRCGVKESCEIEDKEKKIVLSLNCT